MNEHYWPIPSIRSEVRSSIEYAREGFLKPEGLFPDLWFRNWACRMGWRVGRLIYLVERDR